MRALAASAVVVCLALGLGLQLLDRSPLIDALGGILYVVLVGLLLLLVRPALPAFLVASVAFALATVVELLQLTGIPAAIVAVVPPARLVLGSAFDPLDIAAYACGALILLLVVRVIGHPAPL